MPVCTFGYPARKIIFSHRLSNKNVTFTSQVSKKVDVLFSLFHYIFVYCPPLIPHFLLFNCQFSVASLTNISKKNFFSHFQKGAGTQVNYSFKIYIKRNFFLFFKKGAGKPYRRVPSQKKPCKVLTNNQGNEFGQQPEIKIQEDGHCIMILLVKAFHII